MLQPLQLEEVSARYPHEIAELRNFLLKAGTVPSTEHSLSAIVDRLQHDRAFHRDLTSHLWVVIHLAPRDTSYADLLGILAIAAAGPHFAAQAPEDDAHILLRFVLEARRALDQGPGGSVLAPSPAPAPPRQTSPVAPTPAVLASTPAPPPVQPIIAPEEPSPTWQPRPSSTHFSSLDPEEPESARKPLLWLLAACALLALSIGLFFHFRATPAEPAASTPESAAPTTVAGESTPAPTTAETSSILAAPAPTSHETKTTRKAAPSHERERHPHTHPTRSPIPEPANTPPTTTASAPPPAVTPRPAIATRPNPPVTAAAPPKPAPAPSTPYDDHSHIALTAQPPHLERRTPEQRGELTANTLNTTVHATTLGAGASSVLYSPVPAYPPAAASAHVQGEVKVQATVDPNGNVASVRVISGPPLLREAALDAAQRWRFRPNRADGEAISMSTTTVFTFQLP